MPELPEVEHARGVIERAGKRATITSVRVHDPRIVDPESAPIESLAGHRIVAIERRGKWLKIETDQPIAFSHLGMTGKWIAVTIDTPPVRFEKVAIDLVRRNKRSSLRYADPRILGRVVVDDHDIDAYRELGPDPLVDGIDIDALSAKLARRSIAIKAVLLDQSVLAGVGNIQATEALFGAKIDPHRAASSLSRREVSALARSIDRSIARTIAMQSGPDITYVEERGATNPFRVYGRGGEPCPRCKRPLTRVELAGRTTVYCDRCQR